MKNRFVRRAALLLALLVLLFGIGTLTGAMAEGNAIYNVGIKVQFGQSEAREMLDMVNDFRTGSEAWYWASDNQTKVQCTGLSPLRYDYGLEKVAMQRAAEIAIYDDHTRPNGSLCFEAYSLSRNSYWAMGENIAAGYGSASSVYKGWREDNDKYAGQGHRRNMLSGNFNAIGIGHVYFNGYHYWVQEFGNALSNNEPETPANDSSATVSVQIASSMITRIDASAEDLTMEYGDSMDLSSESIKLRLRETWPGGMFFASVAFDWKVEDSSVVSLEGGKLTALRIGGTKLSATVLGQQLTKEVQVKAKKIDDATVTLDLPEDGVGYYNGAPMEPAVLSVVCGDRELTPETDYSVAYADNAEPGTARVTITGLGNYTGSAVKKFTIRAIPPTSLALSESGTVDVDVTGELQLKAVLEPSNAWSKFTWSTSNKKIAKVDTNGLVTPVKVGKATISVKASEKTTDGRTLSASVTVQVADLTKPTKVTLDQSGTVKLDMGSTLTLNATLEPETARSNLKWSTSNKKVATVKDGVVTARKAGSAKITVQTRNGKKASVQIKVIDPSKATAVALDHTGTVELPLNEKLTLTATMQPETATSKLTWTTSNKKVATVKDGVVTPKKKGTVTITVKTSTGKKASVKVKVVAAVEPEPAPTEEIIEQEIEEVSEPEVVELSETEG